MKFLHCADLHLDMPFSSLGAGNGKALIRRKELKETFIKIIDIAKQEAVDAILICGDFYEHDYSSRSTIVYVNEVFKSIPEIRIFIVPGNHDPYIPNSFYSNFIWADNVVILSDNNPYTHIEDLNTSIYGSGFKSFYEHRSLAEGITPVDFGHINIFMSHGTVDMNVGKSIYNPMSGTELSNLGMDYIALGHFHNKVERISGFDNIFNPGSPEPLGFDETGEHGVFIVSITCEQLEKHLDVKFVNTGKKTYENIDINLDGCISTKEAIERIIGKMPFEGFENKLLNVTLKGYIPIDNCIDFSDIQKFLDSTFFFAKLKNETLIDYDFEKLKLEYGLKGLFTQKMLVKIEMSDDENEKRLLEKALYYGLEALENGNIRLTEE